eukprot:COSAG01_NODE_49895_length_368_cov_0.765799_2_plen_67_part_01
MGGSCACATLVRAGLSDGWVQASPHISPTVGPPLQQVYSYTLIGVFRPAVAPGYWDLDTRPVSAASP